MQILSRSQRIYLSHRKFSIALVCFVLCTLISRLLQWRKTPYSREVTIIADGSWETDELNLTKNPTKGISFASKKWVEDVDENFMFYNSIPKTGSLGLSYSLAELSRENDFKFIDPPILVNGRATLEEQQRLAAELFNFVGNNSSTGHKERRAIYRKHYYFIDFWKHGFKMPIYFNTVRDPVAREFSKFYFVRAKHVLEYINDTFKIDIEMETWLNQSPENCIESYQSWMNCTSYDFNKQPNFGFVAYFCGQEPYCWKRNSKKALGKALENIEKFYPVVGVLEKWNETLTVMEEFPKTRPFFKGITDIYYSKARKEGKEGRINYNDSNKPKQGITPKVKEALGEMLSSEYTLYKFLMKRLMNQYAVVTLLKNISSSHDASSRGEAYVFDDE